LSPFPTQMEDHWSPQPDADPVRTQLMWFMHVGDQPEIAELVRIGQDRLAGLGGLDLVPREWLHMTTLTAGFSDEITADQVDLMTDHARQLLARIPPTRITLGRILYHPRAVMLDARPHEALEPVLRAVQEATRIATGRDGKLYHDPWVPHITVAYSNMVRPAAPVIQALGRELPPARCHDQLDQPRLSGPRAPVDLAAGCSGAVRGLIQVRPGAVADALAATGQHCAGV
jgi:2'-5' RNA ligase